MLRQLFWLLLVALSINCSPPAVSSTTDSRVANDMMMMANDVSVEQPSDRACRTCAQLDAASPDTTLALDKSAKPDQLVKPDVLIKADQYRPDVLVKADQYKVKADLKVDLLSPDARGWLGAPCQVVQHPCVPGLYCTPQNGYCRKPCPAPVCGFLQTKVCATGEGCTTDLAGGSFCLAGAVADGASCATAGAFCLEGSVCVIGAIDTVLTCHRLCSPGHNGWDCPKSLCQAPPSPACAYCI